MSQQRQRRSRWILWSLVAAAVIAVAAWGYLRVQKFESLTLSGRVAATSGLESLQAGDAEGAVSQLRVARRQLSQARDLLGPEWLQELPWLGPQLAAVDDLCTLGAEASAAGIELARLLQGAATVPDQGRLNQLIQLAHAHLPRALTALVTIADLSERLDPEGLVPPLAEAVSSARRSMAAAEPLLRRSRALLGLESHLFSREHRFLVITQDSAELRPTGGSIETFGLVEFGPEGFALTRSADIDSLPDDTLDLPIPPGETPSQRHLRFRDANWWLDFPTSAGQLLELWENSGQPDVDGIVAVDIPMIQGLLEVHGPLRVSVSKVPFTADNVIDRLAFLAQSKPPESSNSAAWVNPVVPLTEELVDQVTDMRADQVLPTLEALIKATNEKHMQVYLLDASAQADLVAAGWAGALDPPEGTTDLIAASNSVIERSKANLGVAKTIDYNVRVDSDGSASTTLTLGYQKRPHKLRGVPEQALANYVRAHRLAGTELARKGRFDSLPDLTGLPTFGHYFRLERGSTRAVLRTTVPEAARPVPAAANPDEVSPGWRYRLLVAKQGDLVDTAVTAAVTVPDGWRVTGAAARYRVTGAEVETSASDTTVKLAAPLKEDLILDVTLSRS